MNTGVLSERITAFAVAINVSVGTKIFLFLIPNDLIDISNADVHELVATANRVPTTSANLSSNSLTFLPCTKLPECNVSRISFRISSTSLSEKYGLALGYNILTYPSLQ